MKTRLVACLFLLSLAGSSALVVAQGRKLPDRVATHFNADGQPDGWSSKPAEISLFLSCLTWGIPLFIAGMAYAARFQGPESLPVPNGGHWRSLENHPKACAILFRYALLLGAASAWWSVLLHAHIVAANQGAGGATPAELLGLGGLMSLLAALLAAWVAVLWLRFHRIPGMS